MTYWLFLLIVFPWNFLKNSCKIGCFSKNLYTEIWLFLWPIKSPGSLTVKAISIPLVLSEKICREHLSCFNHFFALINIIYFKINHILFYFLFISNMLIIFLITSRTHSKPVASLFYAPFNSNFSQPIINILSTLLTRLLLLGSTYFSVANLPRPSS